MRVWSESPGLRLAKATPGKSVMHSAGHAVGMRAELILAGPAHWLYLRYTQALLTQMGQTAVCNRHDSVRQQLYRWLLMRLDRLPSDHATMTEELIANILGVRHEGVTEPSGNAARGCDQLKQGPHQGSRSGSSGTDGL